MINKKIYPDNHFKFLQIIFILLIQLISTGIYAQISLSDIKGNVKEALTQAPLENVTILILSNSYGSHTDSEGNYIIKGVRSGDYIIQASMTGYKSVLQNVSVTPGNNPVVNFTLLPETYKIDSVNIIAEKEFHNLMSKPYTESLSLAPAISKVDETEIQKQGARNLIDALNLVPGGLTETRGRQVKQFFSVRGQKYPYPDYAINGVWQKEFEELPYFFPTSDIEEIEIVRSSAALLTGLSGLSGLINIKTREYLNPETNLELEYGSFNKIHSHISNGNKIGHFSYAAGAGYDKFDGPEGKHAKEAMGDLYAQVNWQPVKKISLKANLFLLDGKRELRIAELPADQKYRDMVQNFDPYRAILSNLKVAYRPSKKYSSEVQLFYSYRDPKFNDEIKETSSKEKDIEWGLNFIQSVSLTSTNILRFGGLYDHWIAPNGKRFYTGKRCDTETFSGVLVDEQIAGPVTFDAGIRWTRTYLNDYAAFNIEGEGSQFKNVTPVHDQWEPAILQGSLGLSWRLDDKMSFYLNSAGGQVKPRQGTLDINFNNPLNESRLKFDLGAIRKFNNSGKLTITAFSVIQKNAIALSGSVFTDTVSGIIRELYINRNQTQWGLEFELFSPRLFNLFKPFLNFTVMNSKMEKNGIMIVNNENPSVIAGGGIYGEKKSIDFNIFGKYVSYFENERFAPVNAGPQPLGDFFVLDMNGGYTTKGKMPLRIYVKISNLTNKKYSTVVGYPDFGRLIFGGIQFRLVRENDIKN